MKDNQSLGGILRVLLLVLFIGLKLGNVIAWSWWWVLSPIWIPWVFIAAVFVLLFVILAVARVIDYIADNYPK